MTDATTNRRTVLSAAAWLAVAIALLLFANGRWIVPLATWLAPAALLVFLDRARATRGIAAGLVTFILVQFVIWRGLIPAPGLLYYLIAGIYGVVYFVPFVAHRMLAPRLRGVPATLVFPVAWVAVEFVFQTWGTPYGSWFSLAYTQAGSPTLLQVVSITGTAGVSFLITWFAAIVAQAFRRGETERSGRLAAGPAAITGVVVLLAVLGYGHLRLSTGPFDAPLIRAAGLVPDPGLMREHEMSLLPARGGATLNDADMASIVATAGRLNDDLFRRTRREAAAGAKLIAWSEAAGRLVRADEAAFLDCAGRIARDHGVCLMLGCGVWDPDAPRPFDNQVIAIDGSGSVRWHYRKANPIAGAESSFITEGDGVIRPLEVGDAAVGAVICHDLDFPRLFRQVRDSGIGVVVGPSADWRTIASLHADMATLRAIENGFSLLRPTSGGRSIAVDARGRTIAAIDFAEDGFVACLPTRPSPTVYGRVGDLFSWTCVVGFVALVVLAVTRGREAMRQ